MAHMRDMEELLEQISSADIRDYMREALSCYMAGAYRGTVVLSFIALFDDLHAKLGKLAPVNGAARTLYQEITRRKDDQDVYESYLVDQLAAKDFISGLDKGLLDTIKTLRNKSSHPSGHKPSAEEARYIFAEVITRFISRPQLSTTLLVDEIIARMKNGNFFPSLNLSDLEVVVKAEIEGLHPDAIPALTSKLIEAYRAPDLTTVNNARFFLIGLAKDCNDKVRAELQSKVVASKADDEAFGKLVFELISACPKLFLGLKLVPVTRICHLLNESIEAISGAQNEAQLLHPSKVLSSLATILSDDDYSRIFSHQLDKLFSKRVLSKLIIGIALERTSVRDLYLHHLLAQAGSSQFDTANAIAKSLHEVDNELDALLTDEQALKLIIAITNASSHGAFSANDLARSRFVGLAKLRERAIKYLKEQPVNADAILKSETRSPSVEDFSARFL